MMEGPINREKGGEMSVNHHVNVFLLMERTTEIYHIERKNETKEQRQYLAIVGQSKKNHQKQKWHIKKRKVYPLF